MTTDVLDVSTAKPTQVAHILERSVCMLLSCGFIGNHRKVELGSVAMTKDGDSVDAEKDELGARKKLFSDADLRPCKSVIQAAKHFIRSVSVDGGSRIFGAGAHLLPLLAVEEADRRLMEFKADLAARADELADRLPDLIEQRRAKLGKFFNIGDYPTADRVREAFSLDWVYVSFGAPDRLQEVDRAAYERAVATHNGKLALAYDDVVLGLREAAMLAVRELVEKLKPGEDGKPKALRSSALRDIQELLQRLPVLNSIGDDGSLTDALSRVGVLASGMDVETLRQAPGVRAMLLEAAEQATARLGELVLDGRRAMNL